MKKLFWLCVAVLMIFSFAAGTFAGEREKEGPVGKVPARVGWCGNYMMHEWYQNVQKGMRERAEMLGIELEVVDSSQDMAKQVSLAEDLIAKGVDVLIVTPVQQEGAAAIEMELWDHVGVVLEAMKGIAAELELDGRLAG